jgi:hypothetical protein
MYIVESLNCRKIRPYLFLIQVQFFPTVITQICGETACDQGFTRMRQKAPTVVEPYRFFQHSACGSDAESLASNFQRHQGDRFWGGAQS